MGSAAVRGTPVPAGACRALYQVAGLSKCLLRSHPLPPLFLLRTGYVTRTMELATGLPRFTADTVYRPQT